MTMPRWVVAYELRVGDVFVLEGEVLRLRATWKNEREVALRGDVFERDGWVSQATLRYYVHVHRAVLIEPGPQTCAKVP